MLIEEFGLAGDPALMRLAQIVHAAGISDDRNASPEGPGLYAIAHGFALLHGTADHRKIGLETPMYDALYVLPNGSKNAGRLPAVAPGSPGGTG